MSYEEVNKIIEHTVVRILSLRLPVVFIEYTSINTYLTRMVFLEDDWTVAEQGMASLMKFHLEI